MTSIYQSASQIIQFPQVADKTPNSIFKTLFFLFSHALPSEYIIVLLRAKRIPLGSAYEEKQRLIDLALGVLSCRQLLEKTMHVCGKAPRDFETPKEFSDISDAPKKSLKLIKVKIYYSYSIKDFQSFKCVCTLGQPLGFRRWLDKRIASP